MSANNFLHVVKIKPDEYLVLDVDYDGKGSMPIEGTSKKPVTYINLEEAIVAANEYKLDNDVEFGLEVSI